MSFLHPWVLLLLGIPALLAGWELLRRGHSIVLPFDHANAARGRGLGRVVSGLNLAAPALISRISTCRRAIVSFLLKSGEA